MAAYAQFGYGGYPSASQLLTANLAQSPQTGDSPNATNNNNNNTSALSGAGVVNVPPLSPSNVGECRVNTGTSGSADVPSGAMSPDGLSQNSNNTNSGAGGGINSATVGSALDGGVGVAGLGGIAGPGIGAAGGVGGGSGGVGGSCCENGRPIMTDPVSGQTVCSCQYDSARLALSSYSRLPAASVGVYGTPYPSTDQNPYQSIGVDSSAFYSPLSNPYALKDSTTGTEMTAWTSAGLQPTTGYYSYDPMSAYGYGPSYDLAARRKNATRESTATLKAWLNEHKKNPYPTKGEKIMLAIITKMTLTQVSTWFANARRRLKKENKMTWEPKNRTDDDDEAMASDDEKEKDELESEKSSQGLHGVNIGGGGQRKELDKDDDDLHDEESKSLGSHASDLRSAGIGYSGGSVGGAPGGGYHAAVEGTSSHPHSYHPYHHQHPAYYQHQQALLAASGYPTSGMPGSNSNINNNNNNNINKHDGSDPKNQLSRDCGVPIPASKPKIWSLADTVACKTPPPAQAAAYMGQAQQQQQQHAMQQAHMNSSGMGNHMGLSQQQQLQPQQQMSGPPPATHMMMSNYGVGTAYSRAPPTTAYGGFLGATMQQLHTTNNIPYNSNNSSSTNSNNNNHNSNHHHNNNNNSSSSSSNIINNNNNNVPAHTNTIPTNTRTMANTTAQQLAAGTVAPPHPTSTHMRPSSHNNPSAAHHPYGAAQRGMGFPEAQPDTPPQTPPNMKQQSVAANLLLTASQIPTIATYRNNGNAGVGGSLNSSGGVYGHSNGMPTGYAMNYSTRYDEYSPRDESSSGSSSCSSADSPRLQSNDGPYKASFKSQQIAGFVSPV